MKNSLKSKLKRKKKLRSIAAVEGVKNWKK